MKTGSLPDKINRNELCWCGSGKKYKKCHLAQDRGEAVPSSYSNNKRSKIKKPIYRSKEYIDGMKSSCRLAKETLDFVEERIRAGLTTNEIDRWVHEYIISKGGIPATLNYNGYPKSCCTSINEVVCHGIPDDTIIRDGDIINVDVTSILNGYHGDTSKTFLIGECSEEAKKITAVSKECLKLGIENTGPYQRIGDIGAIISDYARLQGCSVVEKYVGHGIGLKFHEDPQVPHFGRKGTGELIVPGMFFTIEPMINLGVKDVKILSDGWTAITSDRKLTAQFEHTIYITSDGVEILTD